MKLDYLEDVNEHSEHVVRLYDFDKSEAVQLKNALVDFIKSDKKTFKLSNAAFIEPVNCSLTLAIVEEDEGIISYDNTAFFCELTIAGFEKMIKLIEPFCLREKRGFQFLYDLDNEIDFVLSAGKITPVPLDDEEEVFPDEPVID